MLLRRLRVLAATSAAVLTLALPATAAHALESSTFAEEDEEASAVVSEQITDSGSLGDCTGTAIAPHWVLTAHHCIQEFPTASGKVRVGQGEKQRTVDIDRWEAAPAGDFALLHTAQDMGLSSYPKLTQTAPSSGEATMYGWSADGPGDGKQLPTAKATIDKLEDFGLFRGPAVHRRHRSGRGQDPAGRLRRPPLRGRRARRRALRGPGPGQQRLHVDDVGLRPGGGAVRVDHEHHQR